MVGSPRKPKISAQSKAIPRRQSGLGPGNTLASQGWLGTLKVWQKLLLVAGGFLLPLMLLIALLVSSQNQQIAFSTKEQIGVRFLVPVVTLLENVQKHRDLMNQLLNGNTAVQANIDKVRQDIRNNLQTLKAGDQTYGSSLQSGEMLKNLEEELGSLLKYDASVPAASSWDAHNQFIKNQIIKLINRIANTSNLILDPGLDTSWSVSLSVQALPQLVEAVGQLRGYGSGVLTTQSISQNQKSTLITLNNDMLKLLSETEQSVNYILDANQFLGPTTIAGFNNITAPIYDLKRITENLLSPATTSSSPKDYFSLGTLALDKIYSLYRTTLQELDRLLGERVQGLQRQQLIQMLTVAIALAITFLLVGTIIQRITHPVNQLYRASQALAQGDLGVKVPVESKDEMGALTQTFNQTVQQLKAKADADAQEMQRSVQLQKNIGEFLGVAMDISQGDLTKRGRVTEDVLGNVVDAINLMTEEIGSLLKGVQKAAVQVNQGSAQMDQLTSSMLEGARSQASAALAAQSNTGQMSQAIRQMAERARNSTDAAGQTLQAAQLGHQAVAQTLAGMNGIRNEIQSIAENVQTLAQRSAEIETIARTLEDFASQTNLLALNASFEAAGAGAAGKRFAVVADEIRKLAEDSAKETQRVTMLVRQVQSEITSVVVKTEEGVRGAETGYRVADTAGQRLQEIARLSDQSSELAEQISTLTQQQVGLVAHVDQAVQMIASSAQNTEQASSRGRQAAEIMRKLAEQLATNLGRFQLPS